MGSSWEAITRVILSHAHGFEPGRDQIVSEPRHRDTGVLCEETSSSPFPNTTREPTRPLFSTSTPSLRVFSDAEYEVARMLAGQCVTSECSPSKTMGEALALGKTWPRACPCPPLVGSERA